MNKLFLMKNPEIFQGEKYLNTNKNYFEGWYFKNTKFPKSYIWCQGNNFQKSNGSFMLSIADIPFKLFNFRGIICDLIIDNQEFKFTTYNSTKITKYHIDDYSLNITLKRGPYDLNIESKYNTRVKLVAPVKGKMEKDIFESITALITVTLKKDRNIIFCDTSTNCGLEIVYKGR